MDKEALKNILYGAIKELAQDKSYYYKGFAPDYSHWTEKGKVALQEYFDIITWQIMKIEEENIKNKSKELIVNGLKGDKT